MSLKKTLLQDMKTAMKEKDNVKKNTIQLVRSAVLQVEKDEKVELDDDAVVQIIASQVKKRKSSLPEFEKGGRTDLIEELNNEINILMSYLPKQLSDEELTDIINAVIEDIGAQSMKDMGKVMSAVGEKVKGRADNKRISLIVKQKLSS
ncbi:MAG: GatB/YqeY domain-containing protein [Eubacteriales bacterium]